MRKSQAVQQVPNREKSLINMAASYCSFTGSMGSTRSSLESCGSSGSARYTGALIINADDFGRDHENTQRILECALAGGISSVSAMVFMEDSERAAAIAQGRGLDAGLHLNLTTRFSGAGIPTRLREHQQRLARYLLRRRLASFVFHPGLIGSFEYVVRKQLEEFLRIYGVEPGRIDGHHHMHLCANVLLAKLIPSGTVVRRNFSFQPGERSWANRSYRSMVDRMLIRRHRLTDCFFSLPPLQPTGRMQRILSLAREVVVEVETHSINPTEHRFVAGGELFRLAGDLPVAKGFTLPVI
jgi:chitin disaccharide deacetylase